MTPFNNDRSNQNSEIQGVSKLSERRLSRTAINYLLGSIALIWLVGIIALYYVNHKPFSPDQALSIVSMVFQIGAAFILISLGGALGRRLVSLQAASSLTRLSLQTALGMGLLSIGFLVFGALLGVKPLFAWGSAAVLGVLLRHSWLHWWRDWGALIPLWGESSRIGKALAGGIVAILLFTLSTALAPPLKFDALVYHLALPRAYLTAGKIIFVPQIMFWGMPQLGEMLYTWGMALAGTQAATVLGWGFGILALAGLIGFVKENVNTLAAWVSAASLISGFSLATALAWGYIDWLTILFGMAFLISLDYWRKEKQRSFLILAGIFSGMAFGTKYSAGILFVSGIVVVLWYSKDQLIFKSILRELALFLFCAGLFASPWLIKNLIATGNPIYPLFFPSGSMDALRIDLYQNGAPWGNWLDTILLPFRATFMGLEMAPGYSSSIGPLLLALGLFAGLSWLEADHERRSIAGVAALISIPGLLIWAVLGRAGNYLLQSRLYYSVFPALAVLAGIGFDHLNRLKIPGIRLWRVAGVFVAFVLWLSVFDVGILTLRQDAPREILGLNSRDRYLEENLGWYSVAAQAIQDLPSDASVLMLWEPRSLYCAPKCTPDEVLDRWLHDRAVWNSPDKILNSWQQAGYTYLLYYRAGADFLRQNDQNYQPEDWQSLEVLLSRLPTPVDFGDAYSLYALNP